MKGFRVVDIFNLDCFNHEHIQRILKVLKTFRTDFDIPIRSSNVNNKLLNEIYQQKTSTMVMNDNSSIQIDPWWKDIDLNKKLNDQINMEIDEKVKIKSINTPKKIDEKLVRIYFLIDLFLLFFFFIFQIKRHQDLMLSLEQQLTVGFLTELEILKKTSQKDFELNIIPFLEIFEPKEYVDLMIKVKFSFINFCGTRSKRSVEVYKGKNLDLPQTVTDVTMETSQTVTDIIN
jgi:hypothetical protein